MTHETRRQPECVEPALPPGALVEIAARHEQRRRSARYQDVLADAQQLPLDQAVNLTDPAEELAAITFDLGEGQGRR